MKATIPTFVKAALAGLLLASLAGVGILFFVRPAEPPPAPPQATLPLKSGTPGTLVKTGSRSKAPGQSRPPLSSPVNPLARKAFAPSDYLGTNWIKPVPPGCKLPVFQLRMDPGDLLQLERAPYSDERLPASFAGDGEVRERVGVRFRGDWARTWPKKSFKIFFQKDQPVAGQECLNLNSGWRDPAFVREPLAYHVYRACGAPASQCRMVRLEVNGQFRGLFVEVEQPEKEFLKRHNLSGATIYKADSKSRQSDERNLGSELAYHSHYEKETKKSEDYSDLYLFCAEMDSTTNVLEFFTRRVDVEKYINYLAATALVQNWDSPNKNHFLVYDGKTSKKWLVVPWDLDRTLGDHWRMYFTEARLPIFLGTREAPSTTGWNRMMDRFLSDPTLRARFLDRLAELVEKEFTPGKLFPILDRWEAEIAPEAALDRQRWGGGGYEGLHSGIAQVKQYIEERRAYLLTELPMLRANTVLRNNQ